VPARPSTGGITAGYSGADHYTAARLEHLVADGDLPPPGSRRQPRTNRQGIQDQVIDMSSQPLCVVAWPRLAGT